MHIWLSEFGAEESASSSPPIVKFCRKMQNISMVISSHLISSHLNAISVAQIFILDRSLVFQ